MPILQGRRAVAFAACGLLWLHCRQSLRESNVAFAERKVTLDSQHSLASTTPTGRWRPAADDKNRLLSGNS
jgi:hypothetical protein